MLFCPNFQHKRNATNCMFNGQPIKVGNFAALFICMPVDLASELDGSRRTVKFVGQLVGA